MMGGALVIFKQRVISAAAEQSWALSVTVPTVVAHNEPPQSPVAQDRVCRLAISLGLTGWFFWSLLGSRTQLAAAGQVCLLPQQASPDRL